MRDAPSNTDDVIDSRDVIARIEELEGERADAIEQDEARIEELREEIKQFAPEGLTNEDTINDACREYEWAQANPDDAIELAELTALDEAGERRVLWDASDEGQELKTLKALADQCEGYGDWGHGETLIRGSYFQNYAQELAEDCGMIPKDLAWPCTCIDWEQACHELKMDYMEVDFDGVSYLMRA